MITASQPMVPDYQGGCISNVVPELINGLLRRPTASWMPSVVSQAKQIVLLVLDGLGWQQLQAHQTMMPTLVEFEGSAITSVAPTTTATCLTSLVTGRPPSVHGLVGYRLLVEKQVLNVLRWTDSNGQPFDSIVPEEFQTHKAFGSNEVPVVTRGHFIGSGFSRAHLQGTRVVGYAAMSGLAVDIWQLAQAGEQLIYAYYDGIDTTAHLYGFDEHYKAELYTVDRLIRDIKAGLPPGCVLVVTADHGQVEVNEGLVDIDKSIVEHCESFSGEGRFRWLHVRDGLVEKVVELAHKYHGDQSWVMTKDEVISQGLFGGQLSGDVSKRIGDVALIAREAVAFKDPTHDGERDMHCRHGSLTPAEVLVPLLAQQV